MLSRIGRWFQERLPIRQVVSWGLDEKIPGGSRFWYTLGGATLFAFVIQALTGVWQLFYYVPSKEHAYQSVMYIRQYVEFGWLIHGLHYWGSNAFIVLMSLHVVRVFVWGAYKKPRQLTWVVGVLLLVVVLALSFTGATLAWDELGYWAAEVGTSIAGTVPLIGSFTKLFMRGGAEMDQMALSRFFVFHVAILPGLLLLLIIVHLVAFRQFGSVGPWNPERRRRPGRFWPEQVLKDLLLVSAIFVILVGLSAFWRAPVTGPADPLDNSFTPKPEWQFLFLYQFLKLFKGPWEAVGTVGVPLVVFLILLFLPAYDRGEKRNPLKRPLAMLGGLAFVAWVCVYTILGALSDPGASAMTMSLSVPSGLSGDAKAGADLFVGQGCSACHMIHGQGGQGGPDLSGEGTKGRTDAWLRQQIRDPKSHNPGAAMPAFSSLSEQQVDELAIFLQSLGKSSSSSAGDSGSSSPGSTGDPPAQDPASAAGSAQAGKDLYEHQECVACHAVNGQGGKLGPDLSDEAARGRSDEWLRGQIRDPKSHNPNSVMPAFKSLSDRQVNDLVAYLQSLGKTGAVPSKTPPEKAPQQTTTPAQPSTEPAPAEVSAVADERGLPGLAAQLVGDPSHGKLLYEAQCQRCHGKDGKDNVPNPGSDDGTVPPLSPIDPEIKSEDPVVFAEKIDRFIQHGSTPERPHPEKRMPDFGDSLSLTQQMICQVEAYVMWLNGVDRAKTLYPGVRPGIFFTISLLTFGVVWVVVAAWWFGVGRREREEPAVAGAEPPAEQGTSEPQDEDEEGPLEGAEEQFPLSQEAARDGFGGKVAFVIVVIVVVTVIASVVSLIFSTFVTGRPIPSVPVISTPESHSTPPGPAGTETAK